MTDPHADNAGHDETDMTEMLNELRILLPGAQLLNGFLITLPFNSGFREIVEVEKWIFMATFFCSLSSLILFTAPAVQHRILRPLDNRPASRIWPVSRCLRGVISVAGSVLCAYLVTAEVVGHPLGGAVAALVVLILTLWWVYPWWLRRQRKKDRPYKPTLADLLRD
jgi:hypothetical protein